MGAEEKARSNLERPASASGSEPCFPDVFALDRFELDSAPGEIRNVITGFVRDVVLTVVYSERGERTRIISARRATKHEQREYYRSQTAE